MFYIILASILGLLIIGALGVAILSPSAGTDSRGRPVPSAKGPATATAAALAACYDGPSTQAGRNEPGLDPTAIRRIKWPRA